MDLTPRRVSRRASPIEPAAISLQRTAEAFTHMLEKERHTGNTLDERIKAAEQRLAESQSTMKSANTLKAGIYRSDEQVVVLELQLNRAKLVLSDLIVQNKRLREEIDSVRRGNLEGLNTSRRIGEELNSLKYTTEAARQRTCRSVASSTTTHSKLIRLQEAQDSALMDHSMSSLRSRILEDRRVNREQFSAMLRTTPCVETSENLQITTFLNEKWLKRVQQKRKEVEIYIKHIIDLSSGFNQMRHFSDIDQISDIVKAFMNAIERQQEIQQYLVTISEQIDALIIEQRSIAKVLKMEKQVEPTEMRDLREIKEKIATEIEDLKSKMKKIASKSVIFEREFEILQGPLRDIYEISKDFDVKSVNFATSGANLPLSSVTIPQIEQILERIVAILHKNDPSVVRFHDFTLLKAKQFEQIPVNLAVIPQAEVASEPSDEPLSLRSFRLRAQKALKFAL